MMMPRMVFSPWRHRKAALGRGGGAGIGAFMNRLECFLGLHFAVTCDLLVAGSNPILCALAARKAVIKGERVLVWTPLRQDNWNYWLFNNAKARHYIDHKVGWTTKTFEDPHEWASDFVSETLRSASRIASHSGGSLALFDGADGLTIEQVMDNEICLSATDWEKVRISENDLQVAMERGMWPAPSGVKTYSRRGASQMRRQYVFARRLLVTSPVLSSQCELDMKANPLIRLTGSARRAPSTQDEALIFPIEDIMELV